MKSSLFLTAAGAILAAAGPIDKRVLHTEWVTDFVTVTVTAGVEPSPAVFFEPEVPPPPPAPTSTSTSSIPPPPPPPPSTTSTSTPPPPPPPPPSTTSTTSTPPPPPPPPPSTTKVVIIPEPSPEPEPEPEEPPVVENPDNGDSDLGDYEQTCLDQHNIHRLNHSAPALEWDSELASYAKSTANSCVFAHDMDQGAGGYGQNLATWGSSGDISSMQIQATAGGITDQWYNGEMPNWEYYGMDNPPEGSDLNEWGHFTQVVWKSTERVGCATVQCAPGTVFSFASWLTVCNYGPPGNFGGEYGNNVLKPLGNAVQSAT